MGNEKGLLGWLEYLGGNLAGIRDNNNFNKSQETHKSDKI